MKITLLLFAIILIGCGQSSQEVKSETFGAEMTMTESTTLAEVYQNPDKYSGKEIRLEGTITEVCEKKGCWFKMTDGENVLTVRFKDYGFFVPKDAAKSTATIQGIFETEVDEHVEQEAHEQKEGEESKGHEIAPYSFTASAVVITPATEKSGT